MSAMVQPIPKTTLYKQCQPVYCVLLYVCTVSTLNDKHEVQGTGVCGDYVCMHNGPLYTPGSIVTTM